MSDDGERLVGDVRIGARMVRQFFPDDPDAADWFAVDALFNDELVSELRREVCEAGFAQYPESKAEPLEVTAERFVGAPPRYLDASDIKGSHAFALVQMAKAEYALQQHRDNPDACWRDGLRMAHIAEWWKWRREGLEQKAVLRLAQDEGWASVRKGGAVENEERADTRRRWQNWARTRAGEIRANRALTKSRIAELISKELTARERRAEIVGGDCGHSVQRRHCFVCSRPSRKTILNRL